MKKQKTAPSRIAVSIITITFLFVISDHIIQSTVAQQQNQTSASISPDQLDTAGLAGMLIEDAKASVQNGETQKVLSYLDLAQQQLSTSGENELTSMLIEDAKASVQNGETQKVLSYLDLAQQQLSTSGESVPNDGTDSDLENSEDVISNAPAQTSKSEQRLVPNAPLQ